MFKSRSFLAITLSVSLLPLNSLPIEGQSKATQPGIQSMNSLLCFVKTWKKQLSFVCGALTLGCTVYAATRNWHTRDRFLAAIITGLFGGYTSYYYCSQETPKLAPAPQKSPVRDEYKAPAQIPVQGQIPQQHNKPQAIPQNPSQNPVKGAANVAVTSDAIPVAPMVPQIKVKKETVDECVICMESKPLMKLSCGHELTCKECLNPMIDTSIKSKNTKELRCPELKCKKELEMRDIQAITSKQNADIIAGIKTQELLAKDAHRITCPTPNCGMIYLNDLKGNQSITCEKCKKDFCSKCESQHNRQRITCEQYKKQTTSAQDKATEEWKKQHTKQCPQCKAAIQRTEGCNYMTCGKCKYNFCWICLKARLHNNLRIPGNCECDLHQGVVRNR